MPNDKKERLTGEGQDQVDRDPIVVAPRLEPMPALANEPPESAIGKRIEFARKALKLSVEALARYTSFFDRREKKGISATSLLRYESGEFQPGGREIRILCDALLVPPRWLIYGQLDNAGKDVFEQQLIRAIESFVTHQIDDRPFEGGKKLSQVFPDQPTDKQRRDWLEQARAGTRSK